MADSELMARLAAIEDRLSALEKSSAVPRTAPPTQPVAPPPLPSSPLASPDATREPTLDEKRKPLAQSVAAPPTTPPTQVGPAQLSAPIPSSAPPYTPSHAAGHTPPAAPAKPIDFERFLGVQVAAWIGAIVVIAAIAIFAKFAIDQGWFTRTPPAVKLALAYALSGAFVVAGSLLRERAGRLPSAAMLSAGIGGLFVSTCAGITPLNVLGPVAALVAGVAAAILGGALTLRSREFAVGAISLLGAFIVPVFAGLFAIGAQRSQSAEMTGALYLTGVYAVALALAHLGPPHFAWLRLAGVFVAIFGFRLFVDTGTASPILSISFTALWWAMAVAECSLAATRGRSPRLNTAFTVSATSIGALLALRGAFTANPWASIESWLPLGMAGAAVAGAISLRGLVPPGGVDDRDREEDSDAAAIATACARQSMVLAILAGALVVAQVGVVVRGGALPVTWVAMGAAAILIGRRTGQPWTARLGVVPALLALLATPIVAAMNAGAATTLVEYPSDPALREISSWTFRFTDSHWAPMLVAFGLLFAARFWSIGHDPARRPPLAAGFLAACASLLWIGLSLWIGFSYAMVVLLLAIPAAAIIAGRTLSLIQLVALLGSIVASLGWFATTVLHVSDHFGKADARPQGGVIAAALVVASYFMLVRRFRSERFAEIPAAIGFGFGLAALATLILVERLAGADPSDLSLTTIWAACAVAVVATVGCVAARLSKFDLTANLGGAIAATALAGGLFATMSNAAFPVEGVAWLWHWLLTPATLAVVVFIACALVLRGAFASDATVRTGVDAAIAITAFVGSTALVYRFFDPRVGAPFATTSVIQQSALSVWIASAAVAFVLLGFRRRARALRWSGLALLGVVAVKVLVYDMAGAETIWRVVALLVTGLLLVATSVVYTRAAKATGDSAETPALPPPR